MKYKTLNYNGYIILVTTKELYKEYLTDMYNATWETAHIIVFLDNNKLIERIECGGIWGVNLDKMRNDIELIVNREIMLNET